MEHRRTPFLLVHLGFSSLRPGAREQKGNPVPTIPEKFVGNTTPGVLFAALEKIVGSG
jgi:hypothetical protein